MLERTLIQRVQYVQMDGTVLKSNDISGGVSSHEVFRQLSKCKSQDHF